MDATAPNRWGPDESGALTPLGAYNEWRKRGFGSGNKKKNAMTQNSGERKSGWDYLYYCLDAESVSSAIAKTHEAGGRLAFLLWDGKKYTAVLEKIVEVIPQEPTHA